MYVNIGLSFLSNETASVFSVGHYYPEEVEITQDVAGSNEARVTWSFPEGISNLSYFISSVKRESNDVIIYCKRIAAVNRDDVVNGLEPMGRYTVAVAAVYKDGKERKRVVEYENTGKFHMIIMWMIMYCMINMPYRLRLSRRYKNCGIQSDYN